MFEIQAKNRRQNPILCKVNKQFRYVEFNSFHYYHLSSFSYLNEIRIEYRFSYFNLFCNTCAPRNSFYLLRHTSICNSVCNSFVTAFLISKPRKYFEICLENFETCQALKTTNVKAIVLVVASVKFRNNLRLVITYEPTSLVLSSTITPV